MCCKCLKYRITELFTLGKHSINRSASAQGEVCGVHFVKKSTRDEEAGQSPLFEDD
jgi:hypothetical protein